MPRRSIHAALVVFGTLDQPSGGFLYDRHLVSALEAAGHRVSVVSQPPGLSYRAQRRLGRPSHPVGGTLAGTLAELAPDLILIDELNHAAVAGHLPAVRRGLPTVPTAAIVHHLRCDEGSVHRLSRRREARFLRSCDAWLCNSLPTLRRAGVVSGTRRSSAVVYPAGTGAGYGPSEPVTGSAPRIDRPPTDTLRVVSVGTVIPRKRIDWVIRAMASLTGVSLDVVGDTAVDPSYAARLRRLVERRGLADRVRFHGRVGSAALDRMLREADLLAVPSRHEGFGIVYLEAMTRGVPVIASAAGGARDIVRPKVDGYLVSPRRLLSVRALRRAFRDARDDRPGLAAMARAARRRAQRFPDWQDSMAGAVRFLETVAGAATPPSA